MAGPDLWRGARPILLASASSARRALLLAAGLPVEVEASGLDEAAMAASLPAGDPDGLAAALAAEKARRVSLRHPDRIVLGADQVLSAAGEVFTKAADQEASRRVLARLQGRTHRLHSAAAIARTGQVVAAVSDTADLTVRPLDEAAIARYVERAGPAVTRSVGAYEVEALGIHLFERIAGDHATILGLPLLPLLREFRSMGLLSL